MTGQTVCNRTAPIGSSDSSLRLFPCSITHSGLERLWYSSEGLPQSFWLETTSIGRGGFTCQPLYKIRARLCSLAGVLPVSGLRMSGLTFNCLSQYYHG